MASKYDQWNNIKKNLAQSNHKPPYFKEREIWWLSIRVFSSKRMSNKQGELCKEDYKKVLEEVRDLLKLPPS